MNPASPLSPASQTSATSPTCTSGAALGSSAGLPAGVRRFLAGVERLNLALVAVATIATTLAAGPGPFLWGVLAGGAIGALNFRALVWLASRLVRAARHSRATYALLFVVKLTLLFAVIWLVLASLPVDALGFLLGISTLLPALLVVGLLGAPAPAVDEARERGQGT